MGNFLNGSKGNGWITLYRQERTVSQTSECKDRETGNNESKTPGNNLCAHFLGNFLNQRSRELIANKESDIQHDVEHPVR